MGLKGANGHRDRQIASVAARQHGVALLAQLVAAGVTQRAVARRVKSGHLHRVHRGVYAVGHTRLSKEGRWMAAVLAYGDDATLSHRSAAELWGLLPHRNGAVDITVPGAGGRRRRQGIRLHRSLLLTPAVTSRRNGIPVTNPARTLADLPRVATPEEVRRAIRQAEVLGFAIGWRLRWHPQRARASLPAPLPPAPHPATRSKRPDWSLPRGLSVEGSPPDRRDRRLSLPPRSLGFRSRPRP